jgi:hypothetical protein
MNIIISNKYQQLLSSLDIVSDNVLNGVYSVSEIVSKFGNGQFFNKMIIDVTALKNYENSETLRGLSRNFDASKIILLLDDSRKTNSREFLSNLVNMGIYNFTREVNNIPYLIDHPNSYADVEQYQNFGGININPFNDKSEEAADSYLNGEMAQKVLGIKNLTDGAGATTLAYMLKKCLDKCYKVKCIEVDKTDFDFFRDRENPKEYVSVHANELQTAIGNMQDMNVIIVDLNESGNESLCNDVVYLMETSIVKLNKAIKMNPETFKNLSGKKVVINQSTINAKGISELEKDLGVHIFYNMPSMDDKDANVEELTKFLNGLGFSRLGNSVKSGFPSIF